MQMRQPGRILKQNVVTSSIFGCLVARSAWLLGCGYGGVQRMRELTPQV
jgi:hypothetical protein